MKLASAFCFPSALCLVAAMSAAPASAQDAAGWMSRCSHPLGSDNAPESGKYLLQTMGKVDGAKARVLFDYTVTGSARLAIYPTADKDLLNPYSGARLSVGYYSAVGDQPPHVVKPAIGHVSFSAMGKDFKPIPGAVKIKVVIDGAPFGPYEPNPSYLGSGQYSIWLDTAETDGDAKPPFLDTKAFDALTKAVDGMKGAEVVLIRDGADIVRVPLAPTQRVPWRDAVAAWTSKTRPGVGAGTFCLSGDVIMQ